MRHFTTFVLALTTILTTLFFNGNISIPGLPLPTLAKFFHPVNGFWNNVEKVNISNEFTHEQLSGEGKVVYDDRWVPHIFADNLEDALFLQGYVEAQNRLFQMDFITRAATGQLSEVMGPITLGFDKDRNRSLIEFAADNAVKGWEKNKVEYKLLEKYVAGVNAYINNLQPKDYPFEFKLLGYKPTEWTVKKTALVYKYMADVLAGHSTDMEATNALALLGEDLFYKMYPEHHDGGFPVIPYERKYNFKDPYNSEPQDSIVTKKYYKYFYENRNPGVGSNNWAINKLKSASGNPILCNDPHLSLSLPSIWIEEQIKTPTFNAYGVSFPGFPGIMIGFNENIAWGETNVGHDVEDLFEVKWANDNKTKYILDGKTIDTKLVIKEIKIKGSKSVLDTLKYVHQGVVRMESNDGKSDIAVRWLAADEQAEPEFMTFINLMQAKNLADYSKAIKVFNTPAQNFLFASKDGDIALTVNAKLPVRQKNDGRFIESGDVAKNDWEIYIPREENPFIANPKSGYLTSSNQRSAGSDYPYYYTGSFEHSRNVVINDTLRQNKKFNVDDLKKLQSNSFSNYAKETKAVVIKVLGEKYKEEPVFNLIKEWNGEYTADNKAAVVYENLFNEIYQNTFEEILQYQDTIDILMPEKWRLIDLMKNDPKSVIFDNKVTSVIETMDDIVEKSYQNINKEVIENMKTWGQSRPVKINHYTRLPALSSDELIISGNEDTPNAMQATFGPSWRMVVELSNPINAYGVFPGGQSGNPLSPHYKDQITKWANHEYNKLNLYSDAKEIKSKSTITFKKKK